jgi:asparagine synthase (glutamine-hydrolysing)
MPHLDVREISRDGESPFAEIERTFLNTDGPGSGSRKIVPYLYAAAVGAGARLIMDGYGGDYTLNPRGLGALARHLRRGQFRRLCAELRPHLRATGQSPWQMLKYEIILMQLPQSVIRWQRNVRRKGNSAWARREIQGPYLKELRRRNAAEAKPGIESIPVSAMRARIAFVARSICRASGAGGALPAAAHGLDLTRPFHDKRVVELGLAIPEEFYVRNGLNRYLARRALADIYPPEFQTRGRRNEGFLGDDIAILNSAMPALLAEAERMAKSAKLSAYFDFARIRRVLLLPGPNVAGPTLARKSAALRALLTARFIEWCGSSNVR